MANSTAIQRMAWLIEQLSKESSLADVARKTGIEASWLSKVRNYETVGLTAVSSDVIEKLRDSLRLNPAYFFDKYEGERPYKTFLLPE